MIGTSPHSFHPRIEHRAPPAALDAVYQPARLAPVPGGSGQQVRVRLVNTGTQPWLASGPNALQLTYHLFTSSGDPWKPFSPFSPGVLAFGQDPVALPHNVLPGQSVTVGATVWAPASAGTYRVVWDLEQGTSTWLSQTGVLPRSQTLHVESAVPPPPSASPTPTAEPLEGMTYVRDTSIPDGTTVAAHAAVTKGWLVFNSGQTLWDAGWMLRRVSGKAMGPSHIPVPVTRPCHSATILANLTTPRKPGRYTTVWRLTDPEGTLVGDHLTVVLVVRGGPPPPTPTPSPTAQPTPPRLTPTPTPSG
jgi:hypothetical protein